MRMTYRLRAAARTVLAIFAIMLMAVAIGMLIGVNRARAQQVIVIPADSVPLRVAPGGSTWSGLESLSAPKPPIMSDMSGLFGSPKPAFTPQEWGALSPVSPILSYPDLSFHGYSTGRILPRDFLDITGTPKY